ncbi:MAG: HAD family hydrolase [Acidobacteria bacterium]|nr:HAD family hydrolase [Acidobacteriota bacterium]
MTQNAKRRAIFLDRDGTVAEEVGYINHLSRFRLYPWSAEAIRRINAAGLAAVVVTNQAGAARGYFPEELIVQVNEKMKQMLAAAGAHLDGVYYCPHHPDAGEPPYRQRCGCRKPQPGLLERAVRELNLSLAGSAVIGDRYMEVEMAHRLGLRAALVLTGYGRGELEYGRQKWPRPPDWLAENLLEAVDKILLEV